MRITKLCPARREQTLRVGLLGMSLHCLWREGPSLMEPWERPSFAVTYFVMGIFEVIAGLTGYYVEGVIPRLGYLHVCFDCWLQDVLGIEKDPDLSRRIVDPRHRLAALDAIDRSMTEARAKRLARPAPGIDRARGSRE